MPGFVLALLMVLDVAFYTVQNFFNKLFSVSYRGPAAAATPVFAAIYGLVAGVCTLLWSGLVFAPSGVTWMFGLVNGVVLFLFNLGMVNAGRTGPYEFQSIMMLFGSVLLTLLFTAFFWGDRLRTVQLVGIVLMLAAFVVLNLKGLHFDGVKKSYFFWVALLFFSNGAYSILLDAQQRAAHQTQRNEMIIITYLSCAAVSLVYLLCTQGKKLPAAFRMSRRVWVYALGSSLAATAAVSLLLFLLCYVPASILYAICNGALLVTITLLTALVLREKLTKNTLIGVAIALVSIILLNL